MPGKVEGTSYREALLLPESITVFRKKEEKTTKKLANKIKVNKQKT